MLKQIAQTLGRLFALPARVRLAICSRWVGPDRALCGVSESLAKRPGLWGVYTRQVFYRRALAGVGCDVHFGFMTVFSKHAAVLGDRVYLGRFCTVGWVTIGDDAKIADHVQLLSGSRHHVARLCDESVVEHDHITIGAGAWIGAGAVVMADVGAGAIVGAGAVVIRPVGAGEVVGGVPAKSLHPKPRIQAA